MPQSALAVYVLWKKGGTIECMICQALASRTSQDVLELIQNTSRRFEQTVVMITHNEHIAGLTERIVQIEDGKFLRTGADRNEKYSK